jgi:predicted acylesterase/phospholipase RssA
LKAQLKVATAIASSFFLLAACESISKRHEVVRPNSTVTSGPNSPSENQSNQQPSNGTVAPPVMATPPPAPTPPAASNSFLQKETPKVGLILGPGGMKAYAHIGVLKEFARARIPVANVVGLEWGALVGGLFALQGQANEAEWKSLRLRETDIPGKQFLSTKIRAESIASMRDYFATVLGPAVFEHNKIDFACPTQTLRTQKLTWLGRGSMQDAMSKCLPYPPYFSDNGGLIASPFAVEEAAAFLRSHGANLVIFVNVLAPGDLFPSNLEKDYYVEDVLWKEAQREFAKGRFAGVNLVLNVATEHTPLIDFDDRRALIETGSKSARDFVNKMVTQYGY